MRREIERAVELEELETVADAAEVDHQAGGHFFDPDTVRFFSSRVEPGLYGGRYFVTSEQDKESRAPRRWTVREVRDPGPSRGRISTARGEGFQGYSTAGEARKRARELAGEYLERLAAREAVRVLLEELAGALDAAGGPYPLEAVLEAVARLDRARDREAAGEAREALAPVDVELERAGSPGARELLARIREAVARLEALEPVEGVRA